MVLMPKDGAYAYRWFWNHANQLANGMFFGVMLISSQTRCRVESFQSPHKRDFSWNYANELANEMSCGIISTSSRNFLTLVASIVVLSVYCCRLCFVYNFLHATAARPPTPLTPTERTFNWEETQSWLRSLAADFALFYGSGGFVVGQGYVPKAVSLAYSL